MKKFWYIEVEDEFEGIFDSKERAISELEKFLKKYYHHAKIEKTRLLEIPEHEEDIETEIIFINWNNDTEINWDKYYLNGCPLNIPYIYGELKAET